MVSIEECDLGGTIAKPTLLLISQVYVPDPASVDQHMHAAAVGMIRRGYRVLVFASARGYDGPAQRYGRREMLDGVEIRRFPLSSFGKRSIKVRLFVQALFLLQVVVRGGAALAPIPITSPRRDRLVESLAVDSSKLARAVPQWPPNTLKEGLRSTARWFRASANERVLRA